MTMIQQLGLPNAHKEQTLKGDHCSVIEPLWRIARMTTSATSRTNNWSGSRSGRYRFWVVLMAACVVVLPTVTTFSLHHHQGRSASRTPFGTRNDNSQVHLPSRSSPRGDELYISSSRSRLLVLLRASSDSNNKEDNDDLNVNNSNSKNNASPKTPSPQPSGKENDKPLVPKPIQKVDINKQWDAFSKNQRSGPAPAASNSGSSITGSGSDSTDKDRPSYRDRIMDWMSGGGSTGGTMVQPIRLQDYDSSSENTNTRASATGGGNSNSNINSNDKKGTPMSSRPRRQSIRTDSVPEPADDAWFDAEQQKIVDNYKVMLVDMMAELEKERLADPTQVPANAVAMIQSILKTEMELEIAATKESLSQQDLMMYEKDKRADMESKDVSGPPEEFMQKLIDESEAEYKLKDAAQSEVDDFMRYSAEAMKRMDTKMDDDDRGVAVPEKGANLDQWALDRLQAMAESRQDVDGGEVVMDLLEDSVDDLRKRLEKEARKGSIQPATMKEWQMYRSIATRLVNQDTANGVMDGEKDTSEERDVRILQQLDAWKSYIEKEEITREKSGLTRGLKLPFAWQENWKADAENAKPKPYDGRSRAEVRRDLNRMSLEAMESLLAKSDPARREKLQKEVDYLRANLDDDVVPDQIETEEGEEESAGPVDMRGVFSSSSSESPANKKPPVESGRKGKDVDIPSPPLLDSSLPVFIGEEDEEPDAPPPNTPFFSDEEDEETVAPPPSTPFFSDEETDSSPPPPPKTPFFAESEENDAGEWVPGVVKLGSFDEQKMQAMYRRAGARTAREQEKIRSEWEGFREIERNARAQSGLSEGDGSDLSNVRNLDVSWTDGDFDAQKILASIGPRPKRKKAADGEKLKGKSESDDELRLKSSVDSEEVASEVYRAVAAVGGGRGLDDPNAKSSFEDYMRKEDEFRDSLDSLNEVISSEFSQPDPSFDDVEYSEKALASMKARPVRKRAATFDEGAYSDKGGVLSSEDDSDEDDVEDSDLSQDQMLPKGEELAADMPEDDSDVDDIEDSELRQEEMLPKSEELPVDMPEWLKEENSKAPKKRKTFLGSEIDEVFEDDDYEKNTRQLAEYERQRAGKGGQMGIDISDVLGKSKQKTDEYADYKYDDDYFRGSKGSGWGEASFQARKANLIEYTEVGLMEVNALMDHKDSVYSTGVSQYLPRINKPFKEFGAIFRLEGVLVDVTGLHLEAWTKVAKERGFRAPELEDARRASVTRPEVAVQQVFCWTDDFIECGEIAIEHRKYLREAFDSWMKASGVKAPESTIETNVQGTKGTLALGADLLDVVQPATRASPENEADMLELLTKAWVQTATTLDLAAPTQEEIMYGAALGPDLAVRKAFSWAVDPVEIDSIARCYEKILRSLSDGEDEVHEVSEAPSTASAVKDDADILSQQGSSIGVVDSSTSNTVSSQAPRKPRNEAEFLEIQYMAWKSIAESFGFEPPLPDEVLAAVAIGDVEMAVRDGFGWTEDPKLIPEVAGAFRARVAQIIGGETVQEPTPTKIVTQETSSKTQGSDVLASDVDTGPTSQELLQMHVSAWTVAAESYGVQCPPLDQIQLAMNMDPAESITRLFRWTQDIQRVIELSSIYESSLKNESAQYIQKYNLIPESMPSRPAELSRESPSADEIFQLAFDAWEATAENAGFPPPDVEQVQFALSVGPEDAIVSGFEWASEEKDVLELLNSYKEQIRIRRDKLWQGIEGSGGSSGSAEANESVPMFEVVPNAAKWLKSLLDVEMSCGIVSYLDRDQVDILLEEAGLADLIAPDKRVSASSGYKRDNYQMLGAALRLERRPDHCVVFDSSPDSAIAAHDNDMRSVCLIGPYPRYELLSTDLTTSSFDDLTAMNIRRLFGERVYDQPLEEVEAAQPDTRKRQKTLYWAEE
jgi:beta-phosphoglucomutase-like phosphatase (HAD superfamily)